MEEIRLLVQNEHHNNKRNLIAFNVPVVDSYLNKNNKMRKPPTSPRGTAEHPSKLGKSARPRMRSASTGRDKKSELHARYWAFLFGNLQRAVDEIYQTCETDESVAQCKEVMMILDTYSRDFHNLIEWFKIKWDYESTPAPQRPTSLAWEIRKSSPGKVRGFVQRELDVNDSAKRQMVFDESKTSSSVNSGDESSVGDAPPPPLLLPPPPPLPIPPPPPPVSLQSSEIAEEPQETCEMVDEISQTDREEDVDENGPKYRSVSQQTCPEMESLIDFKLKIDDTKTVKTTCLAPKVTPMTKSPLKVPPAGGAVRLPVSTAKTVTPQVAKTSTIRPAYSAVSRQPWGARPLPAAGVKQSPGRLTRCRTVGEVRKLNEPMYKTLTRRPFGTLGNSSVSASPRVQKTNKEPVSRSLQETKLKDIISRPPDRGSNSKQDVTFSTSSSSLHSSGSSCTVIMADLGSSTSLATSRSKYEADEDGWVKVRSRSRFSPANKFENLESNLSQSASNLKQKMLKCQAKTRFSLPSSAKSLPSLTFGDSKKPERKVKEKEIKKNEPKIAEKKVENRSREEQNNMKNVKKTEEQKDEPPKTISPDLDEDENKFNEEIKKNKETEEMLQKEIHELECTEIEVDIETGDEETDGEITTGTEDEPESDKDGGEKPLITKLSPKKENQYQTLMQGFSWADHMETLNELEKLVTEDCNNEGMTWAEQLETLERLEVFLARHPGRAMELHQKLSSPSRKRTIADTVKRFQARQAKASAKREALQLEKAQKLRDLLQKVDEVRVAKEKLIDERRERLEMKLKRAEENRNQHLKQIMRKAHDEEEKLKEIAFINELEAQNKRHDFLTQRQEQEGRLQGIHEERQRRQEEKAAKEAAFEERRKAIEAERQEKLEKLQERQRKRDEQADKKKQEKEKERQELAREKARDRTERLEALHAAQLEAQEELQKKIQLKQEESARRHEENMEQIRQKALELSILKCNDDITPKLVPYETQKLCTLCNVLISSEVYLMSHLRGRKHQEVVRNHNEGKDLSKEDIEKQNIKIIINAPPDKVDPKIAVNRDRIRSFKKKCKKIKLRLNSRGDSFLTHYNFDQKDDSANKIKISKRLKEIEKLIINQGKGQWPDTAVTGLERAMSEISRILNKHESNDKNVFRNLHGFETIRNILQFDIDVSSHMNPFLPQKCFVTACNVLLHALTIEENQKFLLFTNCISILLDLLQHRLSILFPDNSNKTCNNTNGNLPYDALGRSVMLVLAEALSFDSSDKSDDSGQRIQDIISYTVCVGIVDKLTKYCSRIRDPLDEDNCSAQFLLSSLNFLTTLTTRCKNVRRGTDDATQLLTTLEATEFVGSVSILYAMLLHQDAPIRDADSVPKALPPTTASIVLATLKLLRSVAELDLTVFQNILGAEGVSLQFRHIASYLLWHCSKDNKTAQDIEKELLHEILAVVGFFAVKHRDNQMILQSGTMPTVLQQLCNLPFPYFCNPDLSNLLFPTLLACCHDNEENQRILQQEISYSLLENYSTTDAAKSNQLVILMGIYS